MTVITDSSGQALFIGNLPLSTEINGDVWSLPPGPRTSQSFFILELDVYQPGSGVTQPFVFVRGAHPRGAVTLYSQRMESNATLYASDMGYRSKSTDSIGVRVYPGAMDQAFEIDRHVGIAPGQRSTATFGVVRLSNLGQRFDAFVQGKNCNSRDVRLLIGNKTYDQSRGLYTDPSYNTLTPFFAGTAGSWLISEDELQIPLKDATYWADRPVQSKLYAGTGGLAGGADLTGRPIPMVRGGSAIYPVLDVPLTLVDAVNLIYQYNDGPGSIVNVYEGGANVFFYEGDATDLYAGTPPAPGNYRSCNALGLIQMGSIPVRTLTADCVGFFPVAGPIQTAVGIARYLLTETMAQPLSMVDVAAFAAADTAYPYTAGFYAGNGENGLDIVQYLLGSVGGTLTTSRSGKLSALVLRKVTTAAAANAIKLSRSNDTEIRPVELQPPLSPPAYRWRVGYSRTNQVITSDYSGSITATRKAKVSVPYQYVTWSSSDVLASQRRPSDPDPVGTALLVESDAQAIVNAFGELFGEEPKLWEVLMPITGAVGLDIGSLVRIEWPLVELANTLPGQIVGEQVRSFDSTVTFTVLVGDG